MAQHELTNHRVILLQARSGHETSTVGWLAEGACDTSPDYRPATAETGYKYKRSSFGRTTNTLAYQCRGTVRADTEWVWKRMGSSFVLLSACRPQAELGFGGGGNHRDWQVSVVQYRHCCRLCWDDSWA